MAAGLVPAQNHAFLLVPLPPQLQRLETFLGKLGGKCTTAMVALQGVGLAERTIGVFFCCLADHYGNGTVFVTAIRVCFFHFVALTVSWDPDGWLGRLLVFFASGAMSSVLSFSLWNTTSVHL